MNKDKEIQKINECISDLVYEKTQLRKAYNYYHCIRDAEQFRHIEENYGIGTPTSVSFTPLIKKHIDVLVGEYLELDPSLQISCKDENTISNIMRDKQLKISESVFNYGKQKIKNDIIQNILGTKQAVNDPVYEKEIERIKADINKNYVSEYEIAAQNIINYIKHSRDIDLKNKMRSLITDLLIGGLAYYRTKPNSDKSSLKLEVLNPLDTFIERNHNEYYLNKSPRAVIRKWLTKEQILAEFGDELNDDAKSKLNDKAEYTKDNTNSVYVRVQSNLTPYGGSNPTPGILGGLEVSPRKDPKSEYCYNSKLIKVYECEWIEFDEKENKQIRHEGVKIGDEIYITRGESEFITRSVSNPKECTLSVNGIFFSDKNGDPFSIMLNTMDLQDKYDLTIYYRDSLIASSGSVGDWLDAAHLPTFLGKDLPERAQKWIAYKKQGIAWYDTSQEGLPMNTAFGGFDDTVKAQCVQAFQIVLQSYEEQASAITGVFGEKLGEIQQRDAVSNVKVGIRQSTMLTKQYFMAMDSLYKEVNYDLLNLAKLVFKNGLTGTIINGTKLNQIFTALPEYYTMTDFDIHIQDSSESFQDRETLKSLSIELVKANLVDPAMLLNIITAKNMSELKSYLNDAVDAKKKENDTIQQLNQQLQQTTQETQELQKQFQALQKENKSLQDELESKKNQLMNIEQQKVKIEEQKANNDKEYNDKIAEIKEKQLKLEYYQIRDNNPYNDIIKDV